jgi:hypothetical protein
MKEPDDRWFKIINAKYLDDKGFFGSDGAEGSQFWKALHWVKHLFKWGVVYCIGNGKACRFWEDCCAQQVPLKISYENIYKYVRDPMCVVADCWDEDSWVMDFRRSPSRQEYNSWMDLLDSIQDITLTDNKADSVIWVLNKNNQFSTKSLYRFLTDRGVSSRIEGYIWKSKIPLKIKFFLWQAFNNKLQVAQNLVKKKWKGCIDSCLCGCVESVDHVLFKCHLAMVVWSFFKEVFCLDEYPTSLEDFSFKWLRGKGPLPTSLIIFIFAGCTWALWTTRNKMAVEKKVPRAPSYVIYTALSLMQKWSFALKEKDLERFGQVKDAMLDWLKSFKPTTLLLSDVYEI